MGYDILPQFCQRLRHIQVVVGQLFLRKMGQQNYSTLRNTQLYLKVHLHVKHCIYKIGKTKNAEERAGIKINQ